MLDTLSEVPEQVSSHQVTGPIEGLTLDQLIVRLVSLEEKVSGMAETLDSLLEDNTYPEMT